MRFRLTWHDTDDPDKYTTERRYEFLGDRGAIWRLWFELDRHGNKHVAVYSLDGALQKPEKGKGGLVDYNI